MIDFKGSNLKQKQEYEQILINIIVFFRLQSISFIFQVYF